MSIIKCSDCGEKIPKSAMTKCCECGAYRCCAFVCGCQYDHTGKPNRRYRKYLQKAFKKRRR